MSANKESYDQLLVIFGASGDLTSRKLLPAFSELFSRGLLPDRFAILGAARSDFSDISFRRSRRQVLKGDRAGRISRKSLLPAFRSGRSEGLPKACEAYRPTQGGIASAGSDTLLSGHAALHVSGDRAGSSRKRTECTGRGRRMAPDHRRKTVRQRSGDGAQTERTAPRNIRRARDIPDRPLSGEGNRPKHSGTAFFERNLRAAVEPELHRPGGNTGYRNPRRGKPGKILRRSRRHARHGTESSDAAHGLCRYGSAAVFEPEPMRDEIVKVFRSLRPYTAQRMDRDIVRAPIPGDTARKRTFRRTRRPRRSSR